MNRLCAIIVVLFGLGMHQISWGMLTVANNKTQMRSLKRLYTKEKCERDEQQAIEKSQIFVNSFGQKSLNQTAKSFCDLSMSSKEKVLSRLSHNQKLFVWFGAKGLDVCFLTTLCNGNEKVAHIYRDEPINKILENYARAKEWSWISDLDTQHCMVLKNSQLRLLLDVNRERFIHSIDIPKLMDALKILKDIEPDSVDMKKAMDSVKIYPSLKERALVFYNASAPVNAMLGSFATSMSGGMITSYLLKIPLSILLIPMISCSLPVPIVCGLWDKYRNFCITFENNVLPNQPTLTDYLKKHNPAIFANK